MHFFRYDGLADTRKGEKILLERAEHNHLFRILRANVGDVCGLLDGKGNRGIARVLPGKELLLEEQEMVSPLPGPGLHLYIAPVKRQKMDLILKGCTEWGISSITPIFCERSVALPSSESVEGRWQDLLFEACKQSGNPYLPRVNAPCTLAEGMKDAHSAGIIPFYGSVQEREGKEIPEGAANLGWFVGPEGGFTEKEENEMREKGFIPLHIHSWILRAETAVLAGLVILRERALQK